MAGNEVEIVVKATDKTAEGVASAGKNMKGLSRGVDDLAGKQRKASKDSEDYGKGLGAAGEAADASETRIMGMKDTVDGVATVMRGPGEQGLAAYLQGWADLASGVANFVVPAMQAVSVANAKAAASSVAAKTATIAQGAASKVAAAGQWLLNIALTANPIGLIVVAIAALVGALVLAYRNSETFRKIVDAAMKGAQKAIMWLVDKAVAGFKILWGGIKEVWGWFKKLTGSTDDSKDATDDAAKSSRDAASAYQEQADAMDELTDRLLGLVDGELDLEDAIDKASAAVKENGATLDRTTDKGRNNERALNDIVRATMGWRKAAQDAGKSQAEQNRITEQGRTALIKAQVAMGASKDEAADYADQLLKIPKTRTTTAYLKTPNIRAVKHNFDVILRDRVINVRVVTTGSTAIRDNDKAVGGPIGTAATGGPRGRDVLVGEGGREIVRLPYGSQVMSNPDTERILAGGGGRGGGGVTMIDLFIGGRALGRLIIDPLRGEIRTQGGDVQAVLGSG